MFNPGDIVRARGTDALGIVERIGEETFYIRYFFKYSKLMHYGTIYYISNPESYEQWEFIGH